MNLQGPQLLVLVILKLQQEGLHLQLTCVLTFWPGVDKSPLYFVFLEVSSNSWDFHPIEDIATMGRILWIFLPSSWY